MSFHYQIEYSLLEKHGTGTHWRTGLQDVHYAHLLYLLSF